MENLLNESLKLSQEFVDLLFHEMDLLRRLLGLILPILVAELLLLVFLLTVLVGLLKLICRMAAHNTEAGTVCVGFFHPYSQAGGGGERVLWCGITALMTKYQHVNCVVYTDNADVSFATLARRVKERFDITLPRPVKLVPLHSRLLLEEWMYPRFTLVLQALGSIIVAVEALGRYKPDVFVDTMGYSFVYPLVKIMAGSKCKVACYIHYPTISTDMLEKVEQREEAHNNDGFIARSSVLSWLKKLYYQQFSQVYGFVGRQADVIMVNSTWTKGHIVSIWDVADRAKLVFPPCNIDKFRGIEILPYSEKMMKKIVSIGQFRPEKNHPLQLRSFKRLLELVTARGGDIEAVEVQLVVVGGARGDEDRKRVDDLQTLCVELNIENQVEWRVNMKFNEMIELLQESCVGLHTMWNEHFGISVVEMQAAGLITVAHDSGGPKCDIVVPHEDNLTGLLACDEESYAESLHIALTMCDEDRKNMQEAARASSQRFTDRNFAEGFVGALEEIMPPLAVSEGEQIEN